MTRKRKQVCGNTLREHCDEQAPSKVERELRGRRGTEHETSINGMVQSSEQSGRMVN